MKTTNYAGIDYGHNKTNIDKGRGIRYGVISQHSLSGEAMDDLTNSIHSTNPAYDQFVEDAREKLSRAINETLEEIGLNQNAIERIRIHALDYMSEDIGEAYISDNDPFVYQCGELIVQSCLDSDVIVLKSTHYTYAQFCSPCVPGACNLNSPLEEPNPNNKCYCLDHSWFKESQAPYPVYSVETGELVLPTV